MVVKINFMVDKIKHHNYLEMAEITIQVQGLSNMRSKTGNQYSVRKSTQISLHIILTVLLGSQGSIDRSDAC